MTSVSPLELLVDLTTQLRKDFGLDKSPGVRLDDADPDYLLLKVCIDAVRASYGRMRLLSVSMSEEKLSATIFALNGALTSCLFQLTDDLETYARLRVYLSISPR